MTLKKISPQPLIKFLASPKLTVICLFLLLMVVIWGTVYQVDHGLYASQQKFFYSWFVFLFGVLPIPGTVLIFWVLFLNVLSAMLFRIPLKWSNTGNILTHAGILIFFVGSFFTYYFSQESMISLREGEEKHFSISSRNWELAVWKAGQNKKIVYAVDADGLGPDDLIRIEPLDLDIRVLEYYKNCQAYVKSNGQDRAEIRNASGIHQLKPEPGHKEPSKNRSGLIFSVHSPVEIPGRILLFGGDRGPTLVEVGGSHHYFSLRKKRFLLPFALKLIDFKRIFYPGSSIIESYESRMELQVKELLREVIISMNKPLRYKNFTLYQSSYFIAKDGTEYSVLAVVENSGKFFPYIASIIIFMGLCVHFILMLMKKRKNQRHSFER